MGTSVKENVTMWDLSLVVKITLKSNESVPFRRNVAKLIDRVRHRAIFELEEVTELVLVQLADLLIHVLR